MKFQVACDMGSVKIVGLDFCVCFANGFGDGIHDVHVHTRKVEDNNWNFEGHFTVLRPKSVRIATYDCRMDTFEYTFPIGRWFVYSDCGTIHIVLTDKDIHA